MSKDNEEPDCARKGMAWVDFTEKPKRRKKMRRRKR